MSWQKRQAGPKARPPHASAIRAVTARKHRAARPRNHRTTQRRTAPGTRTPEPPQRPPPHRTAPNRHRHHEEPRTGRSSHETPPKPRTASDHRQPAARGRPEPPPEGPRGQGRGGRRDAPDRQARAWTARAALSPGIRGAQSKDPARAASGRATGPERPTPALDAASRGCCGFSRAQREGTGDRTVA